MKILLILLIITGQMTSGEEQRMSYIEASKKWREVTRSGIMPDTYWQVKKHIGYNDAIISYFRDGPGVFNVAPDQENAALDRLYYLSISDSGFEILELENISLNSVLDQGDESYVVMAERLVRERYNARILLGSLMKIKYFNSEKRGDAEIKYYLSGLKLAELKLKNHQLWRSENNNDPINPKSKNIQDNLYVNGIKVIHDFIENIDKSK